MRDACTRKLSGARAFVGCAGWAACTLALLAGTGRARAWQPPVSSFPGEGLSSAPAAPQAAEKVVDLRVIGNETVDTDRVIALLRTRKGRDFDPLLVQQDKHRLVKSGLFREAKVYRQQVRDGVVVTFEVFERPTIRYIEFHGDRGIRETRLRKECGLAVGEAMNAYTIKEGRRKLQAMYQREGYSDARVTILEGTQPQDRGIVYGISEGPLQRISSVAFIGNKFASTSRLLAVLRRGRGLTRYRKWIDKVNSEQIDEDVDRLKAYYRTHGYFGAQVSRVMSFDDTGKWLDLQFVIDEGPRYRVRHVEVVGSERFASEDLESVLQLHSEDHFDQNKMNGDLRTLKDLYGSQGHIYAEITADPRFDFETPGVLDLVYNVSEGARFRVGRINVHIAGETPHTRESVVRNRISLRPGDIVDMREITNSIRRLKASQLFENNPANGKAPDIKIRSPQLRDAEQFVRENRRGTVRGQGPELPPRGAGSGRWHAADVDVYVTPSAQPRP